MNIKTQELFNTLCSIDPKTTWDINMYGEHLFNKEDKLEVKTEVPYLYTKLGYFVGTTVIHNDIIKSVQQPVLSAEGKQIIHPSIIDIQNSIDVCLEANLSMFIHDHIVDERVIPEKGDYYAIKKETDERSTLFNTLTTEVQKKGIPYQQFVRYVLKDKGVKDIRELDSAHIQDLIAKVKVLTEPQVLKMNKSM